MLNSTDWVSFIVKSIVTSVSELATSKLTHYRTTLTFDFSGRDEYRPAVHLTFRWTAEFSRAARISYSLPKASN